MEMATRVIETTGTIDSQYNLHLDEPIPVAGPTKVRVLILLPEEADIDETARLKAIAANPAFDFLKEPEENIYTLEDGKQFNDKA